MTLPSALAKKGLKTVSTSNNRRRASSASTTSVRSSPTGGTVVGGTVVSPSPSTSVMVGDRAAGSFGSGIIGAMVAGLEKTFSSPVKESVRVAVLESDTLASTKLKVSRLPPLPVLDGGGAIGGRREALTETSGPSPTGATAPVPTATSSGSAAITLVSPTSTAVEVRAPDVNEIQIGFELNSQEKPKIAVILADEFSLSGFPLSNVLLIKKCISDRIVSRKYTIFRKNAFKDAGYRVVAELDPKNPSNPLQVDQKYHDFITERFGVDLFYYFSYIDADIAPNNVYVYKIKFEYDLKDRPINILTTSDTSDSTTATLVGAALGF